MSEPQRDSTFKWTTLVLSICAFVGTTVGWAMSAGANNNQLKTNTTMLEKIDRESKDRDKNIQQLILDEIRQLRLEVQHGQRAQKD